MGWDGKRDGRVYWKGRRNWRWEEDVRGGEKKRGIEEKMAWEGGRDRKEREVIGDEEGGEILREAREGG